MGSSLGRLDGGEAANAEAMKVLIERYEEIKKSYSSRDSGSSGGGSSSSRGSSGGGEAPLGGTVIPGLSDRALYLELEHALIAALPSLALQETPTTASREGTTPPSRSSAGISSSRDHARNPLPETGAAAAPGVPRVPSVLVVDDSNVSCQIAKRGLSNSNIGVEVAQSGELGLAMLDSNPSAFDLVLLDVVMPGLHGLQVLDRMKQDPRLRHIPVVVLSGLEDERIAEACKQHGAVEVLHKPMATSEVVRMVNLQRGVPVPPGATAAAAAAAAAAGGSAEGARSPFGGGVTRGGSAHAHHSAAAYPPPPPPSPPPPHDVSALSGSAAADTTTFGGGGGGGGGGGRSSSKSSKKNSDGSDESQADGAGHNAKRGWGDAGGGSDSPARSPFEGGMGEAQVVPSSSTAGSLATAAAPDSGSDIAAGATSSEGTSTARKVTILVVDDSVISSRLAIRKLRLLGYETLIATNGKTALEQLRRYPDRVSFVLLDIIMPVMTGIEFLQVLKTDPDLCHIPVLVVSSLEREHLDKLLNVGSGVLAVLKKPLDVDELQHIVAREGLALPTPPPSSQDMMEEEEEEAAPTA
eukprot:g5119.t1